MPPASVERHRLQQENPALSYGQSNIFQVLLSILSSRRVAFPPGFPRNQFRTGSQLSPSSSSRDLRDGCRASRFRLLSEEVNCDAAGNLADAANQLGAFGSGDDAAGVQQIE